LPRERDNQLAQVVKDIINSIGEEINRIIGESPRNFYTWLSFHSIPAMLSAAMETAKDNVKYKDEYKNIILADVLGRLDDIGDWGERYRRARRLVCEACRALERSSMRVLYAEFTFKSKALVGVSSGLGAHVFEVGISWDPILDLPVVRGSAIKGAVSGAIEAGLAEALGLGEALKKERWASQLRQELARASKEGQAALALFGSAGANGSIGAIHFLDAPIIRDDGRPPVEADVITPHYYEGGRPVERELDARPKPIAHLSIPEGSTILMLAAVPSRRLDEAIDAMVTLARSLGAQVEYDYDLGSAFKAVAINALMLAGVGARTGKGYGSLELDEQTYKTSCKGVCKRG